MGEHRSSNFLENHIGGYDDLKRFHEGKIKLIIKRMKIRVFCIRLIVVNFH